MWDALDANVHAWLRLATLVIGSLEACFVVVDLLTTPPRWALQVAAADLALAACCFAAYYALRRGAIQQRHAHPIAAALALLISLDTVHDAWVLQDPQQTTYLILVVLGAGSIFLSARWLYVVVAGTLAGWSAVALAHPAITWTTFGFALAASCVLSILIHAVRYKAFERMEALRTAGAESEDRYKRLVEGAPDGFLVISGLEILYANPAAARMFGVPSAAQLQGVNALTLVHPEDRALVDRRTAAVQKGVTTDPVEIRCLRRDGSVINVDVIGQPITYLGRPADQTVIRDVTDRRRAEAERQVARERLAEISRLKELDRVKTQFVNTISHELRTPLTPIRIQLHLLKGSKDTRSMSKAASMLERNVTRLSGLVDELLEVASIQAGTLKLAKVHVDLGATVAQALDSYVDVAREKQIELRATLGKDVPVFADPKRIQQIVYNLLGNAFKFTAPGGSIALDVRREGANALVSVRDSGAGMAADDVARLFEPFTQVHDPMEKTNAGTGLGLYICRGIVEGHGGRIWAESDGPGKGSCFSFTVPLETTQLSAPSTVRSSR